MPAPLRWLLGLVVAAAVAGYGLGPARIAIERPRLGIPATLAPGGALVVECATSLPMNMGAVGIALNDGSTQLTIPVDVEDLSTTRYRLTGTVPTTAQPGIYSIELRAGTLTCSRSRAVHIVDEFPSEVCIVQLADLPTFDPDGSGTGPGDLAMRELVDEINIVAPDLVLCSGDIAYGGAKAQFEQLHAALQRLEAPVVVAAGNHEYDGWSAYLETFGPPWHSVKWGPFTILSLNSGHGRDQFTQSQLRWFERELEGLSEQVVLVQLHHPVFGGRNVEAQRDRFVELLREHKVPFAVSGHLHGDRMFDEAGALREDHPNFEGTKYAVTTAAGAQLRPEVSNVPPHHGYRVIRMRGSQLLSITYDYDGDGALDAASSHPAGKLSVERIDEHQLRVRNDWNEVIPNARVTFQVEASSVKGWSAEPGRRLNLRAGDDPARVSVELDLAPQSQTLVRLVAP